MLKYKKKFILTGCLFLVIIFSINLYISNNKIPGTYINRPIEANAHAINLDAPYINQKSSKAWNGCEAASLLEGFHEKGILSKTNLSTFLKQMPYSKSDNPNNGYAGSPYIKDQDNKFQSIYPKALVSWGNLYHHVKDMTGSIVKDLKHQIKIGNPVIVYIVSHYSETPEYQHYKWGNGIVNSHVVLMDGYERGYYHISDPNRGKYWVKSKLLAKAYNYKRYAVAIQ
ncbi:C39 family peptidase [Apilactobacillus apisilvae]|uniref:C39 family peptidase n=1 Tax=Apilactobacillus apisilvae TaxID=2923364 RepID=A0ABY4PGD0_9LACO|nr:C39 family peptidase [Apilactobacillus apisilvae]UQS84652.1 C39 family peptidase [Apilactobacillus apisilvae]